MVQEREKYSDWLICFSSIPLNSYYIERSPVEADCYQKLLQPGAFLRLKAPRQMGKTCLLEVMTQLRCKGYQTLHYNFGLEEGNQYSPKCNLYRQYFQTHLDEINR